jgi:hypothetical protein
MPKSTPTKTARRIIRAGELIEQTITKDGKYALAKQSERRERVTGLPEHPAYVKVSGGITKKLAHDFEFARIDVSVSLPCGTSQVEIDEAYEKASRNVDAKIRKEARKSGVEI